MKTRKQVLTDFGKLQKRFADIRGFVCVEAYRSESDYWCVKMRITKFNAESEIEWAEQVEWESYNEDDYNEAKVTQFVELIESKENGEV
jgi:hypothetical protein